MTKATSGTPAPARETKTLTFEVKDAEKGIIEAVFSTFGVKDHDEDLTLPGAFDDGAKVAISAYGHRSWMGEMPVGRGAVRVESDRAVLEGKFFMSTDRGRETFETVKAMGELQEWSYGFDVLETGELTEELRQKGVRRVLKKVRVYEVSPVLRGAGIDTETLVVKSAAELPKPEEKKEEPKAEVSPAAAEPPELRAEAMKEFGRFSKTRARLVTLGG